MKLVHKMTGEVVTVILVADNGRVQVKDLNGNRLWIDGVEMRAVWRPR